MQAYFRLTKRRLDLLLEGWQYFLTFRENVWLAESLHHSYRKKRTRSLHCDSDLVKEIMTIRGQTQTASVMISNC